MEKYRREIAIFLVVAVVSIVGVWAFRTYRKDNFEFAYQVPKRGGCAPGTKCLCRPFCVKNMRGQVPFDPTYSDLEEVGQYESLGCSYYRNPGQWEYITVRDPQFVGV